MQTKSLYEEYKAQFMQSSQEYCCYCLEHRSGVGCCGENHFVTFNDLYEDDQKEIINAEIDNAYKDMK